MQDERRGTSDAIGLEHTNQEAFELVEQSSTNSNCGDERPVRRNQIGAQCKRGRNAPQHLNDSQEGANESREQTYTESISNRKLERIRERLE